MDHLSMRRALMGSRSQIWMPGTLVRIAPNSPRYSMGASGFGSQVSCWLGPPRIQRMITERSRESGFPLATAAASALSRSAKDRPASPRTPILRKDRRSMASSRRNSAQPYRFGVLFSINLADLCSPAIIGRSSARKPSYLDISVANHGLIHIVECSKPQKVFVGCDAYFPGSARLFDDFRSVDPGACGAVAEKESE